MDLTLPTDRHQQASYRPLDDDDLGLWVQAHFGHDITIRDQADPPRPTMATCRTCRP